MSVAFIILVRYDINCSWGNTHGNFIYTLPSYIKSLWKNNFKVTDMKILMTANTNIEVKITYIYIISNA